MGGHAILLSAILRHITTAQVSRTLVITFTALLISSFRHDCRCDASQRSAAEILAVPHQPFSFPFRHGACLQPWPNGRHSPAAHVVRPREPTFTPTPSPRRATFLLALSRQRMRFASVKSTLTPRGHITPTFALEHTAAAARHGPARVAKLPAHAHRKPMGDCALRQTMTAGIYEIIRRCCGRRAASRKRGARDE